MSNEQMDEELLKEAEALGLSEEDLQQGLDSYGSPTPENKDNVFKFFRELLKLKESWKVGNLTNAELGTVEMGVRHYLQLGNYAEAEQLDLVSEWFRKEADVVAASSMGRKGFLAQLFVTQIKKEQKITNPVPEKKGWFSGGKKNEETQQQ